MLSRIEALTRQKIDPQMPPNPAPHITDRLVELGVTEAAGMGTGPLSWCEIVAWQEATHVRLEPWESRLIRMLSTAYVAEGRRAESENCPPPWRSDVHRAEVDTEEARLRALLG